MSAKQKVFRFVCFVWKLAWVRVNNPTAPFCSIADDALTFLPPSPPVASSHIFKEAQVCGGANILSYRDKKVTLRVYPLDVIPHINATLASLLIDICCDGNVCTLVRLDSRRRIQTKESMTALKSICYTVEDDTMSCRITHTLSDLT